MRRGSSVLSLCTIVANVVGCTTSTAPESEPAYELSPRSALVHVGESVDYELTPSPVNGTHVLEVRDSSVVHVVAPLRVVGARAGETYVLLRSGGQLDSAFVAVVEQGACPPMLLVVPSTANIDVGETLQFFVHGCIEGNVSAHFTSSSPSVAVTSDGLATGVAAGSSVLTAHIGEDGTLLATAHVVVR